ncbi:MAG: NAD(P)H-dependent oxidoreductase [Fibrobacteria bacterium]|nr:NAD(P)H-dependent oxidoreductase [Fibrobacteria bacterium]
MASVLLLFAHPAFHKSRVNKILIESVGGLDNVTIHDLYEEYPDFNIDAAREQELLESHDILIMQFPFFWYAPPALLKEWEDIVLEHGWAYGSTGKALEGKKLFCTISTGGSSQVYSKGAKRFTIRQLLAPIEKLSQLCHMDFLPPFTVHGTHLLKEEDIREHAERYRRFVFALSSEKLDCSKLEKLDTIDENADKLILKAL